ncbi:hypothetical protein EH31_15765 [Erythrobacter longus]|uniref:PilZ domain-containing protein n=1 Tax=Erythrobacter longus TaxID=1044 RepID=A0A074MAM2_ERYLO|nr:hypothetical protein EH31_15765 [Erythrobacter longus]
MDYTTGDHRHGVSDEDTPAASEQRIVQQAGEAAKERARSTRHLPLIRAAKLVAPHGEFVCVVRDVSETGVRLRLFHATPTGTLIELHMPSGGIYEISPVREAGNEVGFEFKNRIDLADFLLATPSVAKRGLRLGLAFPVQINSLSGPGEGIVDNLSQQGARFFCETPFALDQALRVQCLEEEIRFGEVRAKVRWRRDSEYGIVFEDTLSLDQFAELAAKLQCPDLLR